MLNLTLNENFQVSLVGSFKREDQNFEKYLNRFQKRFVATNLLFE